jgi:hypothetical protein
MCFLPFIKDMCTQKETPLFRQLGDQGQKWIQSSITIPGQRVQHDYNLILTGDIGPTYHGDIAIDDLSITDGVCTSMFTFINFLPCYRLNKTLSFVYKEKLFI